VELPCLTDGMEGLTSLPTKFQGQSLNLNIYSSAERTCLNAALDSPGDFNHFASYLTIDSVTTCSWYRLRSWIFTLILTNCKAAPLEPLPIKEACMAVSPPCGHPC